MVWLDPRYAPRCRASHEPRPAPDPAGFAHFKDCRGGNISTNGQPTESNKPTKEKWPAAMI
jgi:hypothetical protein